MLLVEDNDINQQVARELLEDAGFVVELAEEIFHMPVRVGYPQTIQGLNDIVRNPIYATSVGLLQYGTEHQGEAGPAAAGKSGGSSEGWLSRAKAWIQSNF